MSGRNQTRSPRRSRGVWGAPLEVRFRSAPAREAPVGAQCARSSLFRAAQRPCFASGVLAYLEAGLWNCRVSNAGRAVAERRSGLGSGLVFNNRSKRHRSAGGRCRPCSSAAVAKVRSPRSVSRFRALPTAWRCVGQRGVIAFAGQERGFGSAGQNVAVRRCWDKQGSYGTKPGCPCVTCWAWGFLVCPAWLPVIPVPKFPLAPVQSVTPSERAAV